MYGCRSGVADDKQAPQLDDDEDEDMTQPQLTLDEWKALQTKGRAMTNFNTRKPGEGCTSDPSWKKMEVLRKKLDEAQVDNGGQFDDVVSVWIL